MPSKTTAPIYKTAYSELHRNEELPFHQYATESGSPMQDEYSYVIDSFGRKVLEKTGETNLYEKIQASLEETKIENILKRATTGDTSMLRPDGIYADLSNVPNNLIDARRAMQEMENLWNGLDPDIKRKYDFDLDQFIGQSGSEGWLRDMGLLKDKTIEATKVETKTEVKGESKDE